MIGRADIEESKSHVDMISWRPQASYPCGNFSVTSSFRCPKTKRIDRPRFHGCKNHWFSQSEKLLLFCSTAGFRPAWASFRTPALHFSRRAAPAKLPIKLCFTRTPCKSRIFYVISRAMNSAWVLHCRLPSPVLYITITALQNLTGVKLNRVFLPRWSCPLARSRVCGFAKVRAGTVRTSLIHSCTSKITGRGIWLP